MENTNLQTVDVKTPVPVDREAPVTWYRPAVDVLESQDGLRLILDVPGVPPDAIQVQTENLTLTVQGARADKRFGWRRAFTLPSTVDTARIEARAENGVLTLTLPLLEAAKPRKIEVR
jgi:HSP20 family protein